jgi:DNA-binding MarR family transcriptional regulator
VSTDQLAEHLLAISARVGRSAAPALYALLEEHALTLSTVKVLHALDEHADVSVKALAEYLGLSLPGASRALDGLLKRGIVDRREDPHDRRMKRVQLTAAGRELLDEINAARLAGLREFAGELTDDERASLAAALLPILERLDLR